MQKQFTYNVFDGNISEKIAAALYEMVGKSAYVTVCVGSVKVTGDSVAPLAGTYLKAEGYGGFLYGTARNPLTAKEINGLSENVKKLHPHSLVVAVDSAVGNSSEIGDIKISFAPLTPGLAVRNDLKRFGDISIIGVVSGKSEDNYKALSATSFALVTKIAAAIADGIMEFERKRCASLSPSRVAYAPINCVWSNKQNA